MSTINHTSTPTVDASPSAPRPARLTIRSFGSRFRYWLHRLRTFVWPGPWYPNTFWILHSIWLARAVYVAAALGIADLLEQHPRTADQLADETDSDPRSLLRVLRALAAFDVFRQDREGRFHLRARGRELLAEARHSMKFWAIKAGDEGWRASAETLESVRQGVSGFRLAHGMSSWEYYAENDHARANFILAMSGFTEWQSREIVAVGDFSRFTKIVDVGGGRGALIAEILAANPHVRGVVFDLPEMVSEAARLLDQRGVSERAETVGGSFLEAVPRGADLYISKHSLRDWDDEHAVQILRNIHAAMSPEARLMVIDAVIDERNGADRLVKLLDLELMVCEGGGMRTLADFQRLFDKAGFRLHSIRRTCIEDVVLLEAGKV